MTNLCKTPLGGIACLTLCTALVGAAQAQDAGDILLQPIVISASGHAQTLPDAPATVTVIDGDEIASKP